MAGSLCVCVISKEWKLVKNEIWLEEALWHCTEVVLSMLVVTNQIIFSTAFLLSGQGWLWLTSPLSGHSKQTYVLTYKHRALHSTVRASWKWVPGWHSLYQQWNATLRITRKINIYFSSTDLAPKHPSPELGRVNFYWVFIELGLHP